MKKIIVLLIMVLFCFGCQKEDKNITINIYENKADEQLADINESINKTEESQDKDIIYQDDQDIKSDYNNNTTVYRKLKNISERQKYNLYKNINQQKLDNIDYYTESLKCRIINEGGSQYGISKKRCKKMSKV